MKPIQIPLLIFVLFAAWKVRQTYQRRGLRTVGFVTWTLLWLGSAIIIVFPDATSLLAHILGIGRGSDLILYAGLVILFYRVFRIQLALERLDQGITEIVRALALTQMPAPTAADPSQPTPLQRG